MSIFSSGRIFNNCFEWRIDGHGSLLQRVHFRKVMDKNIVALFWTGAYALRVQRVKLAKEKGTKKMTAIAHDAWVSGHQGLFTAHELSCT